MTIDSTADLSNAMFGMLVSGVSAKVNRAPGKRRTLLHVLNKDEREARIVDGGATNSAMGKQKWLKIAKGLEAMTYVATKLDMKVLYSAHGCDLLPGDVSAVRDPALPVCQKLAELVRLRLDYLLRAVDKTPRSWTGGLTSNAVEARIADIQSVDPALAAAVTSEFPSMTFWDTLKDGPFRAHFLQVTAEASPAAAGAAAAAAAAPAAAGAAAATGAAAPAAAAPTAAGAAARALFGTAAVGTAAPASAGAVSAKRQRSPDAATLKAEAKRAKAATASNVAAHRAAVICGEGASAAARSQQKPSPVVPPSPPSPPPPTLMERASAAVRAGAAAFQDPQRRG